jgi:hypothetical protein
MTDQSTPTETARTYEYGNNPDNALSTPIQQPTPDVPIAAEVLARMLEQHDQPRSREMKLVDGLTLTVGVRELYLNVDGEVYGIPHSGKVSEV